MRHDIKIILQDLFKTGFNSEELNDMCSRLQVDYEDLAGQNRSGKAREFINFLHRRKRLPELIQIGQQLRPELDWPEIDAPTPVPAPTPFKNKQALTETPEIYISYAWGGEREAIVDNLEQRLLEKEIRIIRDKRDLGYKGKIMDFMRSIGKGKFVIVVISDKYLKSENCMFELLEIAQQGDFHRRIFPIVLADANIYKAINRLKYIEYWETQIAELDAAMKKVGGANLQGIRNDIDNYTRIRAAIANLTDMIKDMNTLTPEMHQDSDFTALYEGLEAAIRQDQGK